jgi:hypothetical protein
LCDEVVKGEGAVVGQASNVEMEVGEARNTKKKAFEKTGLTESGFVKTSPSPAL